MVLSHLSQSPAAGARPGDLAREMQIPRASLYRVLAELLKAGVVAQDLHTRRYMLGPMLPALGYAASFASPLRDLARPVLRSLAQETHCMTEFVVPAGYWQGIVLDAWTTERTPLGVASRAGRRLPLNHFSAHGLCLLAFGGRWRLRDYLERAASVTGRRELRLVDAPSAELARECSHWRSLGYVQVVPPAHRLSPVARLAAPVLQERASLRQYAGSLAVLCDKAAFPGARASLLSALKAHAKVLQSSLGGDS